MVELLFKCLTILAGRRFLPGLSIVLTGLFFLPSPLMAAFPAPVFSQIPPSGQDSVKSHELYEVVVVGKSKVKEINESAYNVVSIDTRLLHNTTLSLTQTLDRISGVKIREEGGVGSGTRIALNGFSGRHVKIFMDGTPMEGFGSSFQLNNIPRQPGRPHRGVQGSRSRRIWSGRFGWRHQHRNQADKKHLPRRFVRFRLVQHAQVERQLRSHGEKWIYFPVEYVSKLLRQQLQG
jgi:hypothetical protein